MDLLSRVVRVFVGEEEGKATIRHEDATGATRCRPRAESGLYPIDHELGVKILVLGGSRVGKTSIVRRYAQGTFLPATRPTVGFDLYSVLLPYSRSTSFDRRIRLQFWDVAHQESKGNHLHFLLHDAAGVLMVFDVSDMGSLQAVDEWRILLEDTIYDRDIAMLLVGNKSDLGNRVLKPEDLQYYVQEAGFIGWRFTSARAGESVVEAVEALVNSILKNNLDNIQARSLPEPLLMPTGGEKGKGSSQAAERLLLEPGYPFSGIDVRPVREFFASLAPTSAFTTMAVEKKVQVETPLAEDVFERVQEVVRTFFSVTERELDAITTQTTGQDNETELLATLHEHAQRDRDSVLHVLENAVVEGDNLLDARVVMAVSRFVHTYVPAWRRVLHGWYSRLYLHGREETESEEGAENNPRNPLGFRFS